MGKKNKAIIETQVEETQQIISTEIRIISNENLNFKDFKIKKNEEIIISDEVFNQLLNKIPNLELMRVKGVVQIVK